jgi:hypothetical protein
MRKRGSVGVLLKAIAREQRALTGKFFCPKLTSTRAHPDFSGGFPDYEAPSPIRDWIAAPKEN